jgi:hypothetical protein
MNGPETQAWTVLVSLGAKTIELGGKCALDLRPIRITSQRKLCHFCMALTEVVGRSGSNRRHVDRGGFPVFVVTDGERGKA